MGYCVSEKITTDILVIGAGMAGICAAVSAARNGCSVVLLEKNRKLGGNGGADVGVHPSGAHRFHPYAAETGIIEEIIEEAAFRKAKTVSQDKHYNISQQWDTVLSDILKNAGVTVLRCNYAKEPTVENGRITKVTVEDISVYKTREITVNVAVIDSSGDGNISAAAGAAFRMGREAAAEFGERSAPEKADDITMGSSLVAYIKRTNTAIPFVPPENTPEFYPGYWEWPVNYGGFEEGICIYPCETGGEAGSDTIEDEHEIYERLLSQLYAWWEHSKKTFPENEKWELTWVSPIVAKRESRRFEGDYMLTQSDVENGRIFEDEIGFGGFAEDLHYPRAENDKYVKVKYIAIPPLYTIPFRSIYSKDISNLFFASRLCSVSHMAHGTVRLQRTLSTLGMAAGVAAGLCKKYGCTPAEIYKKHLTELQQLLLKQDISLMGQENSDENDLARRAKVTAGSFVPFGVEATEEFLPLKDNKTLMLWDWKDRLDTFSCFLKNTSGEDKKITATLRLFTPCRKIKEEHEKKKFSYMERSNEMEWGVDDTAELFKAQKQLDFTVAADFEGWVNIPFETELIKKDIYNDDARYAVELSDTEDVYWSVSRAPHDFCRRAERIEGEKDYRTYYEGYAFNITPAPLYGEPENVINGINRRWSTNPVNMWISENKLPQSITLSWEEEVEFNLVNITFDTLERAYSQMPFDCGKRVSEKLVKAYNIEAFIGGEWIRLYEKDDNYHRFNKAYFNTVKAKQLRINLLETHGGRGARIYEIRVYNEKDGK